MFSVLFRKSFNGNGLVFGYQTKYSLLRISQLYSSIYSSVFLVFPIIRAISSIVTWLSFLLPTIFSSSVCFTGTFTGTSSFSNPLLSNGIVTVIVDVLKSYALAPYFLTIFGILCPVCSTMWLPDFYAFVFDRKGENISPLKRR